jgi:nitrate reductase assembly molybdenum cofactor insertion protein NarJ
MEKMTGKPVLTLVILFVLTICTTGIRAQTVSPRTDRELLIELRTRIIEMDKRFEQIDKRFEQVDKRFTELREDMNKRFEQIMSFVWILAAIFGAMTAATIGFALWDRKTMIRPFETKVSELDTRIKDNRDSYDQMIAALKEYAGKDKKFATIIRQYNLF